MKKFFHKIIVLFILISIFVAPVGINPKQTENFLENKKVFANNHDPDITETNESSFLQNVGDIIGFGNVDDSFYGQVYQSVTGNNLSELTVDEFGCGYNPLTWHKCFVMWFYRLIFEPLAKILSFVAGVFDFFVYYSINSASYRTKFVEDGWKVIRDVANLFFIISLIYVAVKVVLSLDASGGKKLVGTVVLMAILINFSLFTTKVIIDTSNLLAGVFYNAIRPVNRAGGEIVLEEEKERKISAMLVRQFDPMQMFDRTSTTSTNSIAQNPGPAFTAILMAVIVMGYMTYIFLAVAFLFVSRVVSLWIAMIFSPFAFASWALPFNVPGIGGSNWWDQLWKNAFLAPIFVFFLYIIAMFGDLKNIVNYTQIADGSVGNMQRYMAVIIPFMIILALLKKAKDLAYEYAGEMGTAITGAAKTMAGLAGGAVLGGTAFLGRRVIGSIASARINASSRKEPPEDKPKENLWSRGVQRVSGAFGYIRRPTLKSGSTAEQDELQRRKQEKEQIKLSKTRGRLPRQAFRSVASQIAGVTESQKAAAKLETETERTVITGTTPIYDKLKAQGLITEKPIPIQEKDFVPDGIAKKPEPTKTQEETTSPIQISDDEKLRQERNREILEQEKKEKEALKTSTLTLDDVKGDDWKKLKQEAHEPGGVLSSEPAPQTTTPPTITAGGSAGAQAGAGTTVNIPSGATINVVGGATIQGGGAGAPISTTPIQTTQTGTQTTQKDEEETEKTDTSNKKEEGLTKEDLATKQRLKEENAIIEAVGKHGGGIVKLPDVTSDLESKRVLKDRIAEKGWTGFVARQEFGILEKLSKSSFDLRNTKLFQKFSNFTGIDFGQGKGQGGYEKIAEEKQKNIDRIAKIIQPSKAELAVLQSLSEDKLSIENEYKEITSRLGLSADGQKAFVKNALAKDERYQEVTTKHNEETNRINTIRFNRRNNYADWVARSGGGNLIDWALSRAGMYNPTNIQAAQRMREQQQEYEKTETLDPQFRQLLDEFKKISNKEDE